MDNGKEYMSKEFNNFLKEEGITRQLSVKYPSTEWSGKTRQSYIRRDG